MRWKGCCPSVPGLLSMPLTARSSVRSLERWRKKARCLLPMLAVELQDQVVELVLVEEARDREVARWRRPIPAGAAWLGSGMYCVTASAIGLSRFLGMTFPGNGWRISVAGGIQVAVEGVVNGDLLSDRIGQFREIALAHFRFRIGDNQRVRCAFAIAFVSAHVEQLHRAVFAAEFSGMRIGPSSSQPY